MTNVLLALLFILLLILPQIRGRYFGWEISDRFGGLDISKCVVSQSVSDSWKKLKEDQSADWFVELYDPSADDYPKEGELVGAMERVLFFLAIIIEAPVIIGFWLAFKVASKWAEWQHVVHLDKEVKVPITTRHLIGNYLFGRFITGTGVNLVLALIFGGLYQLIFYG